MTHKEKAMEMVGKMKFEIHNKVPSLQSDMFKNCIYSAAKQCSLIAVNEIIDACEYNLVESYNTDWWNKVKAEIENYKL